MGIRGVGPVDPVKVFSERNCQLDASGNSERSKKELIILVICMILLIISIVLLITLHLRISTNSSLKETIVNTTEEGKYKYLT